MVCHNRNLDFKSSFISPDTTCAIAVSRHGNNIISWKKLNLSVNLQLNLVQKKEFYIMWSIIWEGNEYNIYSFELCTLVVVGGEHAACSLSCGEYLIYVQHFLYLTGVVEEYNEVNISQYDT